jgi:hypothetical protein
MSIIQGNAHTSAGGGYQIERSLRFNSADTAYLNRTPGSAGNRKTWTWSGWVKRATAKYGLVFAAGNTNDIWNSVSTTQIGWLAGTDTLSLYNNGTYLRTTTQVFRDFSAWGHFVIAVDTTQATASNRVKIYFNGVQITAFSTSNDPTLNADTFFNATNNHVIGGQQTNVANSYDSSYMTEINFIDGQALTPSDFGETDSATGVWKPKAYSGTYGTNGFYLSFSDNTSTTTLGYDDAGSNDWTLNNFSVTAGAGNDSLVDSPTAYGTDTGVGGEVRGNYAVLSPIDRVSGGSLVDGNLSYNTNSGNYPVRATIAASSGKWYWEVRASGNGSEHGLALASANINGSYATYNLARISFFNGNKRIGSGSLTTYDTSGAATAGDIYGFAADLDNGTLTVYRNNTSKGTLHSWTPDGTLYTPHMDYSTTSSGADIYNFGQRAFAYTAPSGFKALCTTNLPTPTIGATSTTQANDYFDVTLYTGTDATQTITNSGSMQPDLVWVKSRNGAYNHYLYDSIRGATNALRSSTTGAESQAGDSTLTTTTNGFTVTGTGLGVNSNGTTIVGWQWNAGGSNATNTSGTITSTVRANTTSGFSIVTATAPAAAAQGTVGHGLGVTPSMIFLKTRSTTYNWSVYHASVCDTTSKYLRLNDTSALLTYSTVWGAALPTSSVFGITGDGAAAPSGTFVAYCFAPVAGYSAFGSYTGNGSADGPFVYTGFRPRFVLVKSSTAVNDWWLYDSTRDPYNAMNNLLRPNLANAEVTQGYPDFLSNGWKIRNTGQNDSGQTYIYAAFAETPFKYALAR